MKNWVKVGYRVFPSSKMAWPPLSDSDTASSQIFIHKIQEFTKLTIVFWWQILKRNLKEEFIKYSWLIKEPIFIFRLFHMLIEADGLLMNFFVFPM